MGKKKKRISLCKKAVYKYRFKKKQFLISNIFNFENKEIPENKMLKLETIKEIENENYDNIISDCNPNLSLSESTQNLLEHSKEEESKKDLTIKKLELEKKTIKMMLNPNNKSTIKNNESHEHNLNLRKKVEKNQDSTNEIDINKNLYNVKDNNSFKNKSTTLHLSEGEKRNVSYEFQNKQIYKNDNQINPTSIINNKVFNYYNFNIDQCKKNDDNFNSIDKYNFPHGVYNSKKQNYKLKNNYKFLNSNQIDINFTNYMNPFYPFWYGYFNCFYPNSFCPDPHSQFIFDKLNKNANINKFNSSCPEFYNNNKTNPYYKQFNKDLYNNNFNNEYFNNLYNNPYNLSYYDTQKYNISNNNFYLQSNSNNNNNLKKSSQVYNKNIEVENHDKYSKANKFMFENLSYDNSIDKMKNNSSPQKKLNSKKKNKNYHENKKKDFNSKK